MRVQEIFYSLQGEGLNQGLPTVFVRLQGCNLNPGCSYCDTRYAQKSGGKDMTVDEILAEIVYLSPYAKTRVCLTGGEPLLQEEGLKELVARLNKFNYYIEVFTNGSLPRPDWYTRVHSWVVDIKTPSSGVRSTYGSTWYDSRITDQIKLTVSPGDLDFASEVIAQCATCYPQVIVSPVIPVTSKAEDVQDWLRTVAEFCLEKRVRYSLQWHKILWGNKRGV